MGLTKSVLQGKRISGYTDSLKDAGKSVLMIAKDPGLVWDAIKQPYVEDWQNGDYGSLVGRAVFDVGSLIFGPKRLEKIAA